MTVPGRHRDTYHHGDLRNALITAGAELAGQGGPDAVGIRPAARMVGVTPTAAYRHFSDADQLLNAVKDRAFTVLLEAMREHVAAIGTSGTPADRAVQRLEAIGRAYIEAALAEPGLFRVAFGERGSLPDLPAEAMPPTFRVLNETLDELVDAGVMPPDRRPMAELAAWSAVHGFARLVLDGPLSQLPDAARREASERIIGMVLEAFAPDRSGKDGRSGDSTDGTP
ncbi:TetR/AcrR family transcriptional regulator [Phytoactinopolyspora endophytica]|uniref:TetR/AcrR family transcriptional regulator n=1 Tax=Phytoactinopolyspora endophytica TaxID=1642495 RepID=UPI00197C5C58|nr:TetR/AcrR family transcriptional regulator [Phytoactinopolyspora endophytica]